MINRILGLGLIFLMVSALEIALVRLQLSSTMVQTTPDVNGFLSRDFQPTFAVPRQETMLD